jgi:hypothetical protein
MIFPDFPLYESLKKNDFSELTDSEKDKLVDNIKDMPEKKQEIIYALIKAFYIEEHPLLLSNDLPYSGKNLKNRLKFDLEHIPSRLQFILYSFSLIN